METLEHLSPQLIDGYLRKLARQTRHYILITVPNEKGLVFLSKWLVKKLIIGDALDYTFSELANATLGRMHKVRRSEHKGFDYDCLIAKEVAVYFDVSSISGYPFRLLPTSLCFGVGIVGRKRT